MISISAFGMQVHEVEDNAEVSGVISSSEISRVFVEGDRIHEVKGVKGKYILNKDEKKGDIFIRPSISETIQLYIITEKNRTYQLILKTAEIEAQTIMLSPSVREARTKSEHLSIIYENEIIQFMKNGLTSEGKLFKREEKNIKNKNKNRLILKEKDFYRPGVLAIAIEKNELKPGEDTRVILVKENE